MPFVAQGTFIDRAERPGSKGLPAAAVLLGVAVGAWSVDAVAQETRRVAPGPQYAAGAFHRLVFGSGYRDLWTTPIEVPVLDLEATGGGLMPVRTVGAAQSLGLAMTGADGRSYTFRSLRKFPERMLPEAWRDRWPAQIAQDQVSHTHPAAAVILPALAEAAGVAHTNPRLVVMPDDPALGEFRDAFADELGTIDIYPLPANGDTAGFGGATEIISTEDLWERWLDGPDNRVDSRALLRARVLDLWVDNFDRHRGQWRWMRIPGEAFFQPLPEDPDMVLVHRDGQVMAGLRTRIPRFLKFSERYSRRLDGPLMNSFEVDRWLLADLDAEAWREVARDVQGRMTDAVIDGALRQMPPEWYALDGQSSGQALRTRREGLVDYILRVYAYYAREVDVHATDRDEIVRVERGPDDAVEVSIGLAGDQAPWYRRRFLPDETREVRLYLHGGDDRVTRTGPPGGPILVRVIAGGGHDVIDDSASGGTDVWRDGGTVDVIEGPGTDVREDVWTNPVPVDDAPWIERRSFGHWTIPGIIAGWSPDIELLIGYGFTRMAWGFRAEPNASVQTFRAALATGDMSGKVEYIGTFRRPASRLAWRLQVFGSGIERYNYFGLGNDSPGQSSRARYRTRENEFHVAPSLRLEYGPRFQIFGGPVVRYSRSETTDETILGEQAPLGFGSFGLVAAEGGLEFDSRELADAHPSADLSAGQSQAAGDAEITGLRVELSGFFVPSAWDVPSRYGGLDGAVALYAGRPRAHVAVRVGGRRLWGEYTWFDAAHIGGRNNRGFRSHRFSGDASLFANVALQSWLGEVSTPVIPVRLGLIGLGDAGRIWLDGEASDTWHTSVGGGLIMQPLGTPATFHTIASHSVEGTRFYFGIGYPF